MYATNRPCGMPALSRPCNSMTEWELPAYCGKRHVGNLKLLMSFRGGAFERCNSCGCFQPPSHRGTSPLLSASSHNLSCTSVGAGGMHFVIFGLSISSSWGNGHATLWRGLLRAMDQRGHSATFYEKDMPYYASTRDSWDIPQHVSLRLYESLESIRAEVEMDLARADVAVCTSYCPDGPIASRLILNSNAIVRAFYDLDTPVTL